MWFFMGREAVNLSQQVSTNHLVGLGLIYTPLHNGLIGSRSFQNYAFNGWLALETMKLWLLVLT